MNGLIMLLLIAGVIYIAKTYFKGTKNTDTYSDGFTTRPYGGMDQMTGRQGGEQPRQPWEQGYVDRENGAEGRDDESSDTKAWGDPGDGDMPADVESEASGDVESRASGDTMAFNAAAVPSAPVEPASGKPAADTADAAGKPATSLSDQTAAAFPDSFADAYQLSDSGVQIDTQVQLDAQMPSDPGSTDNQQ